MGLATLIFMAMIMNDALALIRLQAWLSPAFPTGAFAYSHGLEMAIADGLIDDGSEFQQWLEALLSHGPGWNDAVMLAESWRLANSGGDIFEVAELAAANCTSQGRYLETTAQGAAFVKAAGAWQAVREFEVPETCPLPVAVGAVSGIHDVALASALSAFLHAYISNLIQAALRLMPLGQQQGVALISELEKTVISTAERTAKSTLDDLGSASMMADIAGQRHETLSPRIFRS